jgi:hypothetical protein
MRRNGAIVKIGPGYNIDCGLQVHLAGWSAPAPAKIQDKGWLEIAPCFVTSFDSDRHNLAQSALIGISQ